MLQTGDLIPDISLKDQNDNLVNLRSFGKPLVIYFYPKDNTRVCTAQACGFRNEYDVIQDLGAEVIGISPDSVSSHKKVANKRSLPFTLLSDTQKKAIKAFKVPTLFLGLLPARVTFIADKEGVILKTFRADFKADDHIKQALKALEKDQKRT